jgi:putative membrane protein
MRGFHSKAQIPRANCRISISQDDHSMPHEKQIPSERELTLLLAIYVVGFIVMAIRPFDRMDWMLENSIPVAGLIILVATYPRFKFTRLAYFMMFFYLFVQSYGGHYTYALAPPFNWLRDEFHLSRNHYDRLAHFMLGFLMAIPIREILLKHVKTSRRWLAFIVAAIVLAIGAFYEFIEWWVAISVSPELGAAYLGTQGDPWDTHWDMFLALVGAICALAVFMKMHDRQLGADLRSNKNVL